MMRAQAATWHRLLPALPRIALILLLGLVALGTGIGLRDPAPPDEPRFVLAAQAMVETGDWLLPRRGSELYAHKPPVFMWLLATAHVVTQEWRIAFLLPSLLAALGTLWLTFDLGRQLWSPRVGTYAALALLTTLQFGLQARRAQIDMVLLFFTTLALWALVVHLLAGRDRKLAFLGGLAAGVGTVTKGVGFLPLLVFLPWRLLSPARRRHGIGAGMAASGFVVGTMAWLLPLLWTVYARNDPALDAYLGDILLRQTGTRYVDPWHHIKPPWYYLQVMLTLWLPGMLLTPWLVPAWWRRLRRRDPRYWLLLGWGMLVLLFFTATPGKREVYILPALPAFCVAAAPLLVGLLARPGARRVLVAYVAAFSAGLLVLGIGGLGDVGGVATRMAGDRALPAADATHLFLSLVTAGTAGMATLLLRRSIGSMLLAFTLVLWAGYGLGVAPALDASSSARNLMDTVARRIGPDAELGMLAWREQHLLQAPPHTVDFGFERPWDLQWQDAGRWLAQDPSRRWLFVLDEALSPCVATEAAVPIGRSNRRDWLLVPGTAWPPDCVTPPSESDPRPPD